MTTTDKLQTLGIIFSILLTIGTQAYNHSQNLQARCMQEAVPRFLARIQIVFNERERIESQINKFNDVALSKSTSDNSVKLSEMTRELLKLTKNITDSEDLLRPHLDSKFIDEYDELLKKIGTGLERALKSKLEELGPDYDPKKIDPGTMLIFYKTFVGSVLEASNDISDLLTKQLADIEATSVSEDECKSYFTEMDDVFQVV